MLVLRHNKLPAKDLFEIEQLMLKIADPDVPAHSPLDYTLLDKSRSEIYGMILGSVQRLHIFNALDITPSDFLDFLIDVDLGYLPNPYHSFYHAADVSLVLYHMLVHCEVRNYLSGLDVAALFIAGLCHDIGHPGYNNNYQVKLKTELAIRYANKSVLESYSCTLAMDLLSKHKLLRNVEQASRRQSIPTTEDRFRTSIIKMILATDMVFHYELQENFASLLEIMVDRDEHQGGSTDHCFHSGDNNNTNSNHDNNTCGHMKDIFESDTSPLCNFQSQTFFDDGASSPLQPKFLDHQERQMLCQIILHAADISNALRPWSICSKWSELVCEEFFRQGEMEKKHGLPVSPNMDKDQVKQTTIGLQFGDFVVSPYFEIFAAMFPKAEHLLTILKTNRQEWIKREQEEEQHGQLSPHVEHVDHGCQPTDMLPDQHLLNPSGRRVSVAAGMIVIPDDLEERVIGSGKSRRKYLGLRSVSDTGLPHDDLVLDQSAQDILSADRHDDANKNRRKSEEPAYYLYRHTLQVDKGRRMSRGDIVDKCLERQRRVASPR
ncbi:hypothetical protein LRAMOSA06371 [Lichtheimia ramosa]|uniref:Phosphodiesterase n=1 Tax=Lichtheimia ramosa TaxID=688394 RepID=A0A077X2Y1_9FUNG|nr:hypothetical protein LRAMOSA06371 [Lichtheimia ramosa]